MTKLPGLRNALLVVLAILSTSSSLSAGQKKEKQELVRDLSPEQFAAQVETYQQLVQDELGLLVEAALERLENDFEESQKTGSPFIHDVLILSGGGAKGAFGAGVLQGWGEVSEGATVRPEFDIVTGVSTGALIASFAFVGTEAAYTTVADFYANPQDNWVKKRGKLFLLPNHISLLKDTELQSYIRGQVDSTVIRQVAEGADDSRLLLIGATNADIGIGRIFDLGRVAQDAREDGDLTRFHSILLASSAIPGIFPPVEIDDFYYVDGGVASQIYSILALEFAHGPLQRWQKLHPDLALPKLRLWIVVNEKLRLSPTIMQPKWGQIFKRSLEIMMRSSMLDSLRNIQQLAQNARETMGVEVEFRYVAIPDDAPDPPHGPMFDRDFMIQLEELGRQQGADPSSWRSAIPEIHWLDEF